MITASHNPEEYNGIKLFNPDGSSFTQTQQREIEDQITKAHWADWKHRVTIAIDAITPHKNAILPRKSTRLGICCYLIAETVPEVCSPRTPLADAGAKPSVSTVILQDLLPDHLNP